MKLVSVLSMLHEGPAGESSATRMFRGRPVLGWTTQRVGAAMAGPMAVVCWDDQVESARAAAAGSAEVVSIGPRRAIASIDAVTAAQRWVDGWRGGPFGTCHFDRGFHGPSVAAVVRKAGAEGVLLVDPAAGLVDVALLRTLLGHAGVREEKSLVFMATAPGLSGVVLRRSLVEELEKLSVHPGRGLSYVPEHYGHDPLATTACAPAPVRACRTLHRFTLDSEEQVRLLSKATEGPEGRLEDIGAEGLVDRVSVDQTLPRLPRELRIELTTQRRTRAVFRCESPARGELPVGEWLKVLDQVAGGGTRVTFAGHGETLLYEEVAEVILGAVARGIPTAVETDLVGLPPGRIEAVAEAGGGAGGDLLLVHIPAVQTHTYARVMGIDAMAEVFGNLKKFVDVRGQRGRVTPLLVPVFTKVRENLGEMEAWYDHWLKAVGTAVIEGPGHPGAGVDTHGVADMAPPHRLPCRRLARRMQLLSDGRVAGCEYDAAGSILGGARLNLSTETGGLADMWGGVEGALSGLRREHAGLGQAVRVSSLNVLCSSCKEWHRP